MPEHGHVNETEWETIGFLLFVELEGQDMETGSGWTFGGFLTDDRLTLLLAMALNVIYAFVILGVALFVASWAKRRVENFSFRHPRVDKTLFSFLGNLARYGIIAVALVFVLQRFGIQATSLVAVIGAAGLAIGLALQGTLSNLASGIMLVLFRPFRVGDSIEAGGQSGTVKEISLFYSELRTYDGLQIIIPNSDIWSSSIKNYSTNSTRMVDHKIGVSYGSDLKTAERILNDLIANDPRSLQTPEPFVAVTELADSAVIFTVRVWANAGDWWGLRNDLLRGIKDRFDEAGVEIPFPTQTLVYDPTKAAGDPKVPAQ